MAVRVKVEIGSGQRKVEATAFVNTGFETDRPEILLPVKLAELIGLYPPKAGSVLQEYEVVGGKTMVLRSPKKVRVKLAVEDRKTESVAAFPLICEGESEVLISDFLASKLNVSIEDLKEGLWRFRDEPIGKSRPSLKPEYWT